MVSQKFILITFALIMSILIALALTTSLPLILVLTAALPVLVVILVWGVLRSKEGGDPPPHEDAEDRWYEHK